MRLPSRSFQAGLGAAIATIAILVTGCGSSSTAASGSHAVASSLRLGYLANLTHAPAIVAVDKGYVSAALGSGTTLKTQVYNAGPTEIEAILAGALDAAYIGPSPAINGYVKSKGSALRIVSGATLGGAALVVRKDSGIASASDLAGKTLATPQLGNTQDVALRAFLLKHGFHTDPQGGGDVHVSPTDNATALQLFKAGKIDGAWEPEPWSTRMVDEGNGTVLVDEATLWPQGQFATTVLVVSKSFLDQYPDTVKALVAGNLQALDYIKSNDTAARQAVNDGLLKLTQKKLADQILNDAWSHLSFGPDPAAATFAKDAADAQAAGLLSSADLSQLVDLRLLNGLLTGTGKPALSAGGIGQS